MASGGNLVHNFAITETFKFKNKYTLYKITSIVILGSNFPTLYSCFNSKITTWKRFNDIKKLHSDLSKKIKEQNLKIELPKLPGSYFNRFDADIIEKRKQAILDFLYFIGDFSTLYQSQSFVKFFETSHPTPNSSPTHKAYQITETDTQSDSLNNSMISSENSFDIDVTNAQDQTDSVSDVLTQNEISVPPTIEVELKEESPDYLYDAAIDFSGAVRLEANLNFDEAFSKYKSGIDKLLTGAKNDADEKRKKIAKQKAAKYLERAEQLYETHILMRNEDDFNTTQIEFESKILERPMNQLSRFKVMKILDNVMQVQDVTDNKKSYVIKVVHKHTIRNSIFLPQNISYMVPLISYYQTEDVIYLQLHLASGGKLWNYIKNYRVAKTRSFQLDFDEIFVEPKSIDCKVEADCLNSVAEMKIEEKIESEVLKSREVWSSTNNSVKDFENNYSDAVPFDLLSSNDMDVGDIVRCSQQLLKSVAKTLNKSKSQHIAEIVKNEEIVQEDEKPEEIPNDIPLDKISYIPKTSENENDTIDSEEENFLPEQSIKQWASEMIVGVHSLHNSNIICGDLNFNNLLLGSNGELLLSYFYQKDTNNDSFMRDLDQTALKNLYVAPEFPYLTKNSDWWSVGVILYEMLTRKKFISFHPSGMHHYFEIQYPEDIFISNEAKDLLEGLLAPIEFRLNYDLITSHPFFHNTNWTEIERKGACAI